MQGRLWQRALAEFIGTFALIFVGVLAISAVDAAAAPEPASLAGVALAHGLAIAVMVAALGAVSGGHFNPAITAGFVSTGRMPVTTGAVYWLAQLAGGTAAALLLLPMIGGEGVAAGTPAVAGPIPAGVGIVAELVGTYLLVAVVFGTAVDERAPSSVFPFAIGLTITAAILGIGPLTGGAVNPARAFGPALASGTWANQLVYWVGPLAGGVLAAWTMHGLLMTREQPPGVEERGGPTPQETRNVPEAPPPEPV